MLNSSKDDEDAHMNFGIVICFQFLKQFVNDHEGMVWYGTTEKDDHCFC